MTYTVKIRRQGSWIWKSYHKVKGDFLLKETSETSRVLVFEDESRIEVPLSGNEFYFCSRRFLVIKQQMEKDAGQALPVKP